MNCMAVYETEGHRWQMKMSKIIPENYQLIEKQFALFSYVNFVVLTLPQCELITPDNQGGICVSNQLSLGCSLRKKEFAYS